MKRKPDYYHSPTGPEANEALVQASYDRYVRLMKEQGVPAGQILSSEAIHQVNKRGAGQVHDSVTHEYLSTWQVWQRLETAGILVGSKVHMSGPLAQIRRADDPQWQPPERIVARITPQRCLLQFHGSEDKSGADPTDYELTESFAREHQELYDRYVEMMIYQRMPNNKILSYTQLQRRDPLEGNKRLWDRIRILAETGMRIGSIIKLQQSGSIESGRVFTIQTITATGKFKISPKRMRNDEYPQDFILLE